MRQRKGGGVGANMVDRTGIGVDVVEKEWIIGVNVVDREWIGVHCTVVD